MEQWLSEKSGKQLVIVRYSPVHVWHQEWVYNQPDLEAAKVIWARDMGDALNSELMGAYPDREFWLFEPDQPTPSLKWLTPSSATTSLAVRRPGSH
jgi:hypothetical protein